MTPPRIAFHPTYGPLFVIPLHDLDRWLAPQLHPTQVAQVVAHIACSLARRNVDTFSYTLTNPDGTVRLRFAVERTPQHA